MSVDSGANDDAIDYIGPRCAVIAPNVAPIGLSKPHVGRISLAATRRDARIPIVACCNVFACRNVRDAG
jgi:hypothetical protein